jgi:hypothetical protein
MLSEELRHRVLSQESISSVARGAGVPQATLQEFAVGKPDGTYADLRLSNAQKLITYFDMFPYSSTRARKGKRMKLQTELLACNCSDSPEKFKERLIDTLLDQFPGESIDTLTCTPEMSLRFCECVREQVGAEPLHEPVILKALMNIRKSSDCPTGLRSRSRTLLKDELAHCGCAIAPSDFKDQLVTCLASMYRDQTVDELVCHPREAMALCNYVRRQIGCAALSDKLILRTLMNIRKENSSD